MQKQHFFNKLLTGMVLAIVVPCITLYLSYQYKFAAYSIQDFIDMMIMRAILSKLLSLCVLPNLLLFFIFIKLNYLKSARGVLLSTMLLALVVLIVKLST